MTVLFHQVRDFLPSLPQDFYGIDTLFKPRPFLEERFPSWREPLVEIRMGSPRFRTNISFQTSAAAVARLALGLFAFPAFGSIGALYHLMLGATHIVIVIVGARQLFRREALLHLVEGVRHILLAIYNIAVSILSPLAAVAFALEPKPLLEHHNRLHRVYENSTSEMRHSYSRQAAVGIVRALFLSQRSV